MKIPNGNASAGRPRGRALPALVLALALLFTACGGEKEKGAPGAVPEILKVSPHSVTVAWQSEKPGRGEIFFSPAAGGEEQEAAGLSPGTRYNYSPVKGGAAFQFQTQPQPADPFSFVMLGVKNQEEVQALFLDEVPEFFVAFGAGPPAADDAFAPVRPFVPVFTPAGPLSPFLAALSEKPPAAGPFYLDWGGLRLGFQNGAALPEDLFANATAHTFGLVLPGSGAFPWESEEALRATPLHQALLRHNAGDPERKLSFVIVPDTTGNAAMVDEISYTSLPGKTGAVRVDVDVAGVRAVDLADGREFTLKKPPIRKKLTCADCRRLADQGTYEAAVEAYQSFIENNRDSYQVDDAVYAIADILDGKLFRPADALVWYDRLMSDYPDASLAPLARQRAAFLRAYADHDFAPLKAFERIRQVEFLRAKDDPEKRTALLGKVAGIVKETPDAAIAPAIAFWLANQYRETDPETAVDLYRTLIQSYPQSSEARESWVQMGETWYNAGRYGEALDSFRETAEMFPELGKDMEIQAKRCRRNLLRITLMQVSFALAVLLFAASLFWPPAGMPLRPALSWLAAGGALLLLILLGAWLIREQFSSNAEMWLLACSLALAPAFSGWTASTLCKKALGTGAGALAASIAVSLLLFAALCYLSIYFIYMHYLIIIGL